MTSSPMASSASAMSTGGASGVGLSGVDGSKALSSLNADETAKVCATAKRLVTETPNLIANICKYTDKNGHIYVRAQRDGERVYIVVSDTGIGIPKEDQKHMFDRFFRASNAGNIQGTGLGLNIVKRYVELLNGTINFTSEQGKGSTFSVSIPAS